MKKKFFSIILALLFFSAFNVKAVTFTQDNDYKATSDADVGKFKVLWSGDNEGCLKYYFYHYDPNMYRNEPIKYYKKIGEANASDHEIILQTMWRENIHLGVTCKDQTYSERDVYMDYPDLPIFVQYANINLIHGEFPDVEWSGTPVVPDLSKLKIGVGEFEGSVGSELKVTSIEGEHTELGVYNYTMTGSSAIANDGSFVQAIYGDYNSSFRVVERNITNTLVTYGGLDIRYYTGKEIKATSLTVKIRKEWNLSTGSYDYFIVPDDNYDITYEDNIGKKDETTTAKMIITGKNHLTGQATVSFKILKLKDVTNTKYYTIEPIPDQVYSGLPIEPGVTFVEHHYFASTDPNEEEREITMPTTLIEGVDYTLEYDNNVEVGMADVYITGINNFQGTRYTTFNIIPSGSGQEEDEDDEIEMATPEIELSKDENTITLSWEEQPVVQAFELQISNNGKSWKKLYSGEALGYIHSKLTYGKTYYYRLKAFDGDKWSNYSKVVSEKIVPKKVKNVSFVSAGTTSIKIAWDKETYTGYEIYMGKTTAKMSRIASVTKSSTTTYNKKSLKANTSYYFKVRTYKLVSGKRVYGEFSDIVEFKTAPSAPKVTVNYSSYKEFRAIPKAANGATYYVIQVSTKKTKGFVDLGTTTDLDNGLLSKDLVLGTTYYYRAKACNENDSCSGWGKVVSKKVVPDAPSIKNIESLITKKVSMEIDPVEDGLVYEIYRSTNKKSWSKVATLKDLENLTYTNSAKKGTTYYYKVRTYSLVNKKKVYSGYSEIISIKSL